MTDPAPGYGRRPDDPQCYNCGVMGHWAVACPEPTRQTPAGLEAWRNTSHSGQNNNNRDHRGSNKKSKGPIITRYAPPSVPTSAYPSQPTYYAGSSQLPPPPPPPSTYSHPPQPPPTHYPHQPPPPPHYSSYQPQSTHYAPGYHHAPSYSSAPAPPPSYGHDPRSSLPPRPDYPNHPPHPLPPHSAPPPYPSSYNSYPQSLPPGSSPHPPHPSHGPPPRPSTGPPPPLPHSSGYSPQRPPHQRNQPSNRHGSKHKNQSSPSSGNKGQPPKSGPSQQTPLSAMAPSERIAHGLPPKPPAPAQERPEQRKDSRNKKRHESQKGNRDNRQKDQPNNKRPGNQKQQRHNRRRSSQGQNLPKESPGKPIDDRKGAEDVKAKPDAAGPEHTQDSGEVKLEAEKVVDTTKTTEPEPVKEDGEDGTESDWEATAIFQAPASVHSPDEVGKPLPAEYSEEVLLPRKWDSKCIESEFIKSDNLDEFTRPIHEMVFWEHMQFDPAFARDGKLPSGDALPRLSREKPVSENSLQESPAIASTKQDGRSTKAEDFLAAEGQKRKRLGDFSPRQGRDRNSLQSPPSERSQHDQRRRGRSDSAQGDSYRPDRRPTGSSQRRESGTQRRSRSRSRRSSVASDASHSSALDSLDRELLGMDTDEEAEKDQKEDERAPKPKRRRVQVDSAYSRRW